ncbi:MAG: hypothetical protein KIS76_12770 [Pyrinomonadaceae bacterium]|nr:hypothetical protein [Pyrinomonadaceae bacterium]
MSNQIKFSREDLYEKVWQVPTVKIAEEFGISDVMVAKLCRKLDIPKPPRGYWSKIDAGAKREPAPLPPPNKKTKEYVYVNTIIQGDTVKLPPRVEALIAKERLAENRLRIAKNFDNAHSLVRNARQFWDEGNEMSGISEPGDEEMDSIYVPVSEEQFDRALLIMDALFRALEERGSQIAIVKTYRDENAVILKEGVKVAISICESVRKQPILPKPGEKRKLPYLMNEQVTEVYTGKLNIKINFRFSRYLTWRDRKNEPLENRLNEILAGIIEIIELQVEENRKKEEEERLRIEVERRREDEQKRCDKLESAARRWQKCEMIRDYVNAIEAKFIAIYGPFDPESKEFQWVAWARKYADSLDPMNETLAGIKAKSAKSYE